MSNINLNILRLLAAVLVLGTACGKEEQPACVLPEEVSFQQEIVPLLSQHCSLAGCHAGAAPAGNLSLEASMAYSQLTRPGKGYVDTLSPKLSVLYAAMNASANPMPPSGKLDTCSTALVLKWITQKARNN